MGALDLGIKTVMLSSRALSPPCGGRRAKDEEHGALTAITAIYEHLPLSFSFSASVSTQFF